ncbi:hypothetical protein KJ359_010197 [Pestalotiopsis sp. 9143b]|nr:hypothetical protein KJ359_010197 [Pestalotiopsis sp. 9143b]
MFDPQIPIETSMQVALVVIPVVFGLLASVAVVLRIVARHISHRPLEPSDYVMIAALIVTLAFCGLIAAEPFTGAGMHMTDLVARFGPTPLVTYTKMTVANQILWALAVCLPKVSILMLYAKVFAIPFFVTAARITGVIVILLGLATILGALLQCQPFAYNWDQTIVGGHCGDQVLSFKITASINVILDIMVLFLPMPYLANLEMAMRKKIILIVTFAGGFLTCIFSALRISAVVSMDYADLTYLAGLPSIYSVIEPALIITLACVPVLRPLLGGNYSSQGTYRGSGPRKSKDANVPLQSIRFCAKKRTGFLTIDDVNSNAEDSDK